MSMKMICPICGQPIPDVRRFRLPLRQWPQHDGSHCCGDFHLPFVTVY